MKVRKYLSVIILTAVCGILYNSASGEIKLPLQLVEQGVGKTSVLTGIEELGIVIVTSDSEPNKDGLVWKTLETKVEEKLKAAGIKATSTIDSADKSKALNTPELRLYINMLKPAGSQQYVFYIRTSFWRAAHLTKKADTPVKACVWEMEPLMQVVTGPTMPAAVTNAVLDQIDVFVNTYRAAVQAAKVSPAKDNTSGVSNEKRPDKPAAAGQKYYASKTSKKFHKADCEWIKRIKPENLMTYNSRDEAVKADKQPCKQCKP